jgi:hypothetical protein
VFAPLPVPLDLVHRHVANPQERGRLGDTQLGRNVVDRGPLLPQLNRPRAQIVLGVEPPRPVRWRHTPKPVLHPFLADAEPLLDLSYRKLLFGPQPARLCRHHLPIHEDNLEQEYDKIDGLVGTPRGK